MRGCHEGTCRLPGKAGESCDGHWQGCAGSLLCQGYCRRTGNLGDRCESSWVPPGAPQDRPIERRGCRGDGYCDPLTHTCARMARVGEACAPPRLGVDDNPCWISSCDEATRRCAPRCSN